MSDKLLLEMQDFSYEVTVNEDTETHRKITRLRGLFQHAGVQNGNGRVYPRSILETAVNKNKERVTSRQMLGELDHPIEGKIHLDKVSHLVTDLFLQEDGKVIGEVEVFDGPDEEGGTPKGRILGSFIKRNVKLGISSRGFGSTKEVSGVNEVQDDFKLITFDIVSDPSTPDAYPQAVHESNENTWYVDEKQTTNFSELLKEKLED